MKAVAVIPAAGLGVRLGGTKKAFLPLAGRPLLAYTVSAIAWCPTIHRIILVVPPGDEVRCQREVLGPLSLSATVVVVPGGESRQESVLCGLREAGDADLVVVHDGARPCVEGHLVGAVVKAAAEWGAAVTAIPMADTVKVVDPEGWVLETPPRERLWAVQTPQAFRGDLLRRAHAAARAAGIVATDDGGLVERLGEKIRVVPGSSENIKVTTAEDLILAEVILRRRGACGLG